MELLENRRLTWSRSVEIITGSGTDGGATITTLQKPVSSDEDQINLAAG
jgi:hypothetical protein